MSASAAAISGRLATQPSYTLRDLLTALFFHRRAVLVAFAVPVALGLLAALLSPTTYVSQARLLVLLGSEYVFQPQVGEAGAGQALDRNQIMQGELEILSSTALHIEVLKQLGLSHVYPDAPTGRAGALELAAERLGRDLSISSIPQSNVIELDYRNRDPDVAAEVLRTLIAAYLQLRATIFERTPGQASTAQSDAFGKRVQDAEEKLAAFDRAHGITDYDQQLSLLVRQKSDNSAERFAVAARIGELTAQVASLRRQLRGVPVNVPIYNDSDRSQQTQGITADLARLQAQRAAMAARYRADFPLLADLDRQIASMKAQLAQVPAREQALLRLGPNPTYEQANQLEIAAEAELHAQQARAVELDRASTQLQARLDDLTALGQRYRDLRRDRDVLDETYRNFQRNSEVTGLADALQRTRSANVRVVQPPEPPPRGTSLRRLLVAGGVVLGLVSAVATLTLLTALRQVFVSVEDAERALDLPVLVAVPMAGAAPPRGWSFRRPGPRSLRRAWGT